MPLALFRRRSFAGVQLTAFAAVASTSAMYLYLTLYLQSYLGHSPLEAGLRFVPVAIAILLVAPVGGALLSRVRPHLLIAAGLAIAATGLLIMAGLDARSQWTALLGGFLVSGAGVGLHQPALADAAVSVAPTERAGMAAGINNTFRVLGATVGIAAWGALLYSHGGDRASDLAAGSSAGIGERPRLLVEATSSGDLKPALAALPPTAREAAANAAREGFLAGLNHILVLAAGLALAAAVLALCLIGARGRRPAHHTGSPTAHSPARLPTGVDPPGRRSATGPAPDGRQQHQIKEEPQT